RDRNVTGVQTCALPIWPSHTHGMGHFHHGPAHSHGIAGHTHSGPSHRHSFSGSDSVANGHYHKISDPGSSTITGGVSSNSTHSRSEDRRVGKEGTAREA